MIGQIVDLPIAGGEPQVGAQRRFIGAVDAGEIRNLASARLFILALGITRLADGQGGVDEDFEKGVGVKQVAGQLALATER